MANNMNNSLTNVELIDKINILKGTFASRRIVLPSFDMIITANSNSGSLGLHTRLNFRKSLPLSDVKNIVRSYFKRGSYSGYAIETITISIGYNSEFTISNQDITEADIESAALSV